MQRTNHQLSQQQEGSCLRTRRQEIVALEKRQRWLWEVLLLRRFSHVRLLATPWTAAYQAPPSMGFSRQEYWSGVPWPSPWETLHSIESNSLVSSRFASISRVPFRECLDKTWSKSPEYYHQKYPQTTPLLQKPAPYS